MTRNKTLKQNPEYLAWKRDADKSAFFWLLAAWIKGFIGCLIIFFGLEYLYPQGTSAMDLLWMAAVFAFGTMWFFTTKSKR